MIREDAIWNNQKGGYEFACLHCGALFVAKRSDAKFHSAVCRKAQARRKDQIERAAQHAIRQIAYIRRVMVLYPDLEIAGDLELDRIKQA